MAAHYDDPNYSYADYWTGRDYEHQSEIIAIDSLLTGKNFSSAVDIGGGFGRLTPHIAQYAAKTILVEPANKLRAQAAQNLKSFPQISIQPGTAQSTRLPDSSQDLTVMIRVMHHLPEPLPAIKEISRILKPGGILVLEFANSHHFKAQLESWITGQPILLVPLEKRSPINIKHRTIPFVNHSPQTVEKYLAKTGFEITQRLSVSNFRSPFLKRFLPLSLLIRLEKSSQHPLAQFNFGPSIFFLAQKSASHLNGIDKQ